MAIELPRSHAFMHLDTVMSMVDRGTFVLYPYFDRNLRSWTVTDGDKPNELFVSQNANLWDTLADLLRDPRGHRAHHRRGHPGGRTRAVG